MNTLKIITLLFLTFALNWSSAKEIIVTSTADNTSVGTFRQAVSIAMPNDTIIINVKGTITLTSQIDFTQNDITVIGPYPKHNTFTASGTFDMFNFNGVSNINLIGLGFIGSTFRVVRLTSSENIQFESCLFENNTSTGFGSVISASGSSFNILNCSFFNNSAFQGGAIYLASGGSIGLPYKIVNCTFYNNTANGATGNGGAIYFGGTMDVQLINNLFHSNSAPNGQGQALYSNAISANVGLFNTVFYLNGTASSTQIEGANSFTVNQGSVLVLNYTSEPSYGATTYPPSTDLGLRTSFLEDGFGLKYFTIINSSSFLINAGSNAIVSLIAKDCRRAPRQLTNGVTYTVKVDAGPCEYTPFKILNTNSTGPGSFSDVLSAVNAWNSTNVKFVEFEISGFNPNVSISIFTPATLNKSVIIDGYSQNSSSIAGPDVDDGTGVTPAINLVRITTTNNTLTGFSIGANNVVISGVNIYGFEDEAIKVQSGALNSVIYGNHIGFYGNGGSYTLAENKKNGVSIGSSGTLLGGNSHYQRNVITGNGQTSSASWVSNVHIRPNDTGTKIIGNFIGVDPTGLVNLNASNGNAHGIHLQGDNIQCDNIIIGNSQFGGRNVISGNRGHGINVFQVGVNNVIDNNIIGLGYDGTTVISNLLDGVYVSGSTSQVKIGVSKGNIIGGNTKIGINIFNSQNTQIQNNFIGTDITGILAKPNVSGIVIVGAASLNNIIGFDTTTANVISGNTNHGISVIDGDGTWILGNFIGTNSYGTASLGNGTSGVNCESAINTKIGGTQLERNIISGNGSSNTNGGIILSSTGNTFIAANYIGTDVTGTISKPNMQGIITLNTHYANIGAISPNFNVISGNNYDGIEIYSKNTTVDGNIIGLNFDMTNPIPNVDNGIDIEVDSVKIGSVVINVIGSNSKNGIYLNNVNACEIDRCFIGTDPITFSAGSGNQGSGIQVTGGNNNKIGLVASNTIVAHINTGSAGVKVDGAVGTLINNNLIGIVSNGNTIANDIGIQLINGANNNLIGNVLNIDKNVISGNTTAGILIEGNTTVNNEIRGNFIGVGIDGGVAAPNNVGIELKNGANNNLIGADGFSIKRNIISANTTAGVYITGTTTGNNIIYKNYIGSDSTNTIGASNNFGIWIKNCSTSNYIGAYNDSKNSPVISGNVVGIVLDNASTQQVYNSKIGVRNLGNAPLPNVHGIVIQNGSFDNVIGGNNPFQSNIISGNDSIGIAINNCNTNSVLGNRIGTNTSGNIAIGNLIGIFINGGNGNIIGTNNAGEGNLITSNSSAGLILDNNPSSVKIQGNYIGTDSGAVSVFSGSGNGIGVLITNTTNINVVGGSSGEGNYFASNGVSIGIDNSSGQIIQGNVIGINKAGTSYLGTSNTNMGIYLNDAINTSIGGTGASKNAIANQAFGIYSIYSTGTLIEGNVLGSNLTGSGILLTGFNTQNKGVFLDSTTTNSTVGPNNIISGNGIGVEVSNTGTTNNKVISNYIGTDNTGNSPLNNNDGVVISNKASGNFIGGLYSSEENVISGNTNLGVKIEGGNTSNNIVSGNLIGLGIDGLTAIPNGGGVSIELNASANIVGGSVPDSVNYICNNTLGGIAILSNANSNYIRGNKIGLTPNSTSAGNGSSGILLQNASTNLIGGTNAGNQNVIANNTADGIEIKTGANNNIILGNSIYDNGDLAIDINADGVTTNNTSSIQNNTQMPIVLQAFDCDADVIVEVAIQLRNLIPGQNYTIEFYDNSLTFDPSTYGEADVFLNRFNYTAIGATDTAIFDIGGIASSTQISASLTALNGNGGTSEMSKNFIITNQPPSPTITVNDETCQGANDGSITIDDLTNTSAYYFAINSDVPLFNSTFDSTFVLSAGTYTVTSKTLNGCTVVSPPQIINSGGVPTFTSIIVDDTCGLSGQYTVTQSNSVGATPQYYQVGPPDILIVGGIQSTLLPGTYQVYMKTTDAGLICVSDTVSILINAVDLAANGVLDFVFDDFCASGTGLVSTNPSYGNGNYQFNPMPGDGASIVASTGEISNSTQGTEYSVEYFYGTCAYTQTPTAINASDPSFNYTSTNNYCYGIDVFPVPTTTGGTYSFVNPTGDGATIDLSTGLISNETQGSVYEVEYNTGGGCPGKDTISVTILNLPASPEISTTDSVYCGLGENVAPLTTNLGTDVEWYDGPDLNNSLLTVEPTYNISLSSLTGGQNTYFYATVTSSNGCQSFPDSIAILLVDVSNLSAGADVEICTGSEVELNATGGLIYLWDSDNTINDSSVIVSPTFPTTYFVTITDINGCIVEDSVNVGILPASECNIEIYTAFSPNGDGDNDTWIIDGIEGYKENIVYFYNRWGDLVSKIENYDNDQNVWNGKNQFTGQNVSTGTYYYIVEAGGTQARNGWVQIVK